MISRSHSPLSHIVTRPMYFSEPVVPFCSKTAFERAAVGFVGGLLDQVANAVELTAEAAERIEAGEGDVVAALRREQAFVAPGVGTDWFILPMKSIWLYLLLCSPDLPGQGKRHERLRHA